MLRSFKQIRLVFRSVFRQDRVDQELDQELRYHLECLIDDGVARGLPAEEARYAAHRAMGAIAKSREECRDMRGVNFIGDLLRDLRYAGRSLGRNPGFAALAVLIMGLGIGANTAVFSVVNAVLLKPLPYRNPERIVRLSTRVKGAVETGGQSIDEQVSIPNFQDWHEQSSSFEAMAYYGSREVPVMAGATAEYARGTEVGPEFFRVFAVEPIVGRLFTAEEMKQGSGGAAMISYAFWQSHFGGSPLVLGQVVRVYDRPLPVAGVLPLGFGFPDKTDVWAPASVRLEDLQYRSAQNWQAVGRLKPGVPLEQAQTEMTTIAQRLNSSTRTPTIGGPSP